jgi:hypothetical protein
MVKVTLQIELPDELAQEWMQYVRNFDTKHDPNHEGKVKLQMLCDSDWPAERMQAMLQAVSPSPRFNYSKEFDS